MKLHGLRLNQISPFAYAYLTVAVQMRALCPFVYALANPHDDVFAFTFRMFTWLLIVTYPSRLAYALLTLACVSSFRWAQLWHSDAENLWHPVAWYVFSVLFALELARRVGPHYVHVLRLLILFRLISARIPQLANSATMLELLATIWYTGNQQFRVSLRYYPAVVVLALVTSVVFHVQATVSRDVVQPHCDHRRWHYVAYPRSMEAVRAALARPGDVAHLHSGECTASAASVAVSYRFLRDCDRDFCSVGAHPSQLHVAGVARSRSIGACLDTPCDASGTRLADVADGYAVVRDAELRNISAAERRATDVVVGVRIRFIVERSQSPAQLQVAERAASNASIDWDGRVVRNLPSDCGPRPQLLATSTGIVCPARGDGTDASPTHPMLVELVDTVLPLVAFGFELGLRVVGWSLYELSDSMHRRSFADAEWHYDLMHGRALAALQLTPTTDMTCVRDLLRYSRRHVVLQCDRAGDDANPDACDELRVSTVHYVFMPASC